MRKMLLLQLMSLTLFAALAQDKPVFEKKTFTDEKGNIFWNVGLPVYISISSTENTDDGSRLKEVKSEEMKKHAYPMYFDGHGLHYLRHLDYEKNIPENEIGFVIHVDGIAPKSSLTFEGAPAYVRDAKAYFGKNLTGLLAATDEMSGVASVYQSVNGANYAAYSSALTFGKEGEFTLSYFAVDKVGNVEVAKEKKFTVDVTAPTTTLDVQADHIDQKILSPRSMVTLKSEDALSGVKNIKINIDNNAEKNYNAPLYFGALSDGEHSLSYFGNDNVANAEEKKVFSFFVDKTPPTISSALEGDVYNKGAVNFISKATTFLLTAEDNKAGTRQISYSINQGQEVTYNGPVQLPQKQGNYVIRFRAIDNIGNQSFWKTDERLDNVMVDATPPNISHSYDGPQVFTRDTVFITHDTKIKLYLSDGESGTQKIEYAMDNGTTKIYDQPLMEVMEGLHTVSYTGYDQVNNSTNKTFHFIEDNTGPTVFSHLSLEPMAKQNIEGKSSTISVYPVGTVLYLAATDKLAGTKSILYSLNKAAEQLYAAPVKLFSKGLHSIKVRATDLLGNETVSDPIEFVIQ